MLEEGEPLAFDDRLSSFDFPSCPRLSPFDHFPPRVARFQHANHGMHLTREQAQQEIAELQLPEFFLELFAGERSLSELGITPPERVFQLRKIAHSYRLTPIFEYAGRTYCCEHHPEGERFVTLPIDQPGEITVLGRSFQCVLATLFIDFWQDERNDFILPMLAETLEFHRFDELIQEIGAANKMPKTQYFQWRSDFCASCEEDEIARWSPTMPIGAVA